ncbi:Centromere protein M [Hondaea fermentalgiana]|uniref:Centromere protein M n=1 Tax=Hondaea fermentalgiana TaxID=2315210 RepID=A0A2R5GDZ0_9STRA|nr:Centromere protein M [Hondaea fermentalgiana]|eukprot:GBG26431.1 Centromere protein M [Hondaea fermentalgiana]
MAEATTTPAASALSAVRTPEERLGVMIVGIDGIGKKELGDAIVDAAKTRDIELDVFTFSSLPLQEPFARRVDHVIFMIDMASKLSLHRVAASVGHLDCNFALGRSTLVVINYEALNFADIYGTALVYCTLEDNDALRSCVLPKQHDAHKV